MTHRQAGNSVAQRLAGLSPQKRAMLQKRLEQRRGASDGSTLDLPDEADYPLSFNQRRLWFMEQFQPGTPLYNVSRAIRMRGPLDRAALKSSLQSLVDRHEALRTTIQMINGEPVQRVERPRAPEIPLVDLRSQAGRGDGTESILQERLTAEGRRVFDLSTDLMLRAALYQLAGDEHVLQLTMHHLACDGWSLQMLLNELAELYRSFLSGRSIELPPPRQRYVDFARWQRAPGQSKRFDELCRWWNDRLSGAPQILELPTASPRPPVPSGSGFFQPLQISPDSLRRLESFGREEGATTFMSLLAGFFILLHRYTGLEDFLVGSATAGRHRHETNEIVGFFVDTVVLRADLTDQPTAREVLRRVRQTVIDAISHSELPFDQLVESLNLEKDLSRQPLVQVLFNAPPQYSLEIHPLAVSPVDVDLKVSRFDLEVTFSDGDNRTTGITANADLFDAKTIERMVEHYRVVLNSIASSPDQPVRQLPLLTESERNQLFVGWNATRSKFPIDQSVHDLFEQQVERSPDAVAVVFEEQQLTYGELNRQANQLAHHLQRLGVGPETLVAMCLERSARLLVGILGILKAGGAYVPLDVRLPARRLQFMLQDAGAKILVTESQLLDRIPSCADQTVLLDAGEALSSGLTIENPKADTAPDNLAYTIYTSGSTGQPKGVQVTHSAVVNYMIAAADRPGMAADDYLLSITTPSFDISVLEWLLPLTVGATVEIANSTLVVDAAALASHLTKSKTTVMFATPAMWSMLIQTGWSGDRNLKILCGGEAMPDSLAAELLELVRSHRSNHLLDGVVCDRWKGPRLDRPADLEYLRLRAGRMPPAGSDWRTGRIVYRRCRTGSRLSEPSGVDSGEIRDQSVQRRSFRPTL